MFCFFNIGFLKNLRHVFKNLYEKVVLEKAVLLVDNAPSHPATPLLQYKGIIVKFLPLNTTIIVHQWIKEKQYPLNKIIEGIFFKKFGLIVTKNISI